MSSLCLPHVLGHASYLSPLFCLLLVDGSLPLAPSVWLSCCCWGIVGLDSACEGTTFIFRVVLDFGGVVYEGLCFFLLLPLSASQLPSEVTNGKGVGCASGVGLPPTALSPSFLDKRVGTGPTSA